VEVACDEGAAVRLARELDLEPRVARVLACRGLTDPADAARFLSSSLGDLPDPFLMRGMEQAVAALRDALARGDRIALYGDYDVDGVTSTALLAGFLRAVGANVVTYVPHRLVEGYGLNTAAVRRLAAEGAKLLVSLDCGITSVAEVRAAADLGLRTVVVDHHTVPVELPSAAAILNPHQPDCAYPYKPLAAVGVTFCLAMALRKRLRDAGRFGADRPEPNLRHQLDLVALGTVADVVPLTGVNRILVRAGLEVLARPRRAGLRALKRVSGMPEDGRVTAGQVGFRLGPRINAAGRLDDASRGVRLLLEESAGAALALAEELDRENRARQELERGILEQATAQARERVAAGVRGLVLAQEGWHPGVVGIVASRIVERFHRPAILVGISDGVGKGSGRSIEAFHLHDALSRCAEHLTRFGGHRHAAGMTLDAAALPSFRERFEQHARQVLTDEDLLPRCRIEGRLGPDDVGEEMAHAVERLAPFGAGHPEPLFAMLGRPRSARVVGATGAHLKLGFGGGLQAIGFSLGDRVAMCSSDVEAAVTVGFDDWNGARRVQLTIRDLRAPGSAGDAGSAGSAAERS
jgi:single-stranded-DNA-specific exonuclease